MDDIVRQAMAKWPNVPDCYGWLGLDARGDWYMRDDSTQAVGPFPLSRGAVLRHQKLVDFIQRNYDRDAAGCWYFQNGPQRVYVELEAAPLVLRLDSQGNVQSHTGEPLTARHCIVDEQGRLYLVTPRGLGLVHTLDMHYAADLIESARWQPQEIATAELPDRFDFVPSPWARKTTSAF
jgi:hypothetical protein